jgi:hypothetical protein
VSFDSSAVSGSARIFLKKSSVARRIGAMRSNKIQRSHVSSAAENCRGVDFVENFYESGQ